ncbi:hypothetical protein [Paraburkholderia megapolitana]|uniref:ABM domain-containing protein n=1 Tax=Paraburkholderia megapolitana TaxID=420953 RepID=A0A1I3WBG2_9BURK|nr:hypothetical protein [Paraburkholderia megapolitana]QDQ82218.1 hypothetical protein FNZ07_13030 [Paraburkholderia megapolitana]SFK04523.1 hypothetical protein SAMN05192543_11739 [Paraburkholderia megapolitana]
MEKQKYEVVVDDERQVDKPMIALTQCEVTFENRESLDRCIVAVKESTERLNARPVEEVQYDWQSPNGIRGLTLYFGVRWFDKAFFDEHRDVYKNSMHDKLFSKFGVNAQSFKVNHFVAA